MENYISICEKGNVEHRIWLESTSADVGRVMGGRCSMFMHYVRLNKEVENQAQFTVRGEICHFG